MSKSIWTKKYLKVFSLASIIGLLIGAVLSFIYYWQIGCEDGCAIRSNPYLSVLWGSVMGYFLGDLFYRKPIEKK